MSQLYVHVLLKSSGVNMSVNCAHQKPLIYNKFLPYAAKLDEESKYLFEDIKHYLSVTVQKSELWPGAVYWTNRLNRYIHFVFTH